MPTLPLPPPPIPPHHLNKIALIVNILGGHCGCITLAGQKMEGQHSVTPSPSSGHTWGSACPALVSSSIYTLHPLE